RFQERNILLGDADALGQFLGSHLALGQHDVEVDDDRHLRSHTNWRCSSAISAATLKIWARARRLTRKSRFKRSFGRNNTLNKRCPGGRCAVTIIETIGRVAISASFAIVPSRAARRSQTAASTVKICPWR